MIGKSIGSYRITAKLGAGGMGEVWKARDTKLGRDVALKLLPAAFASDPDRMTRFEREARVLASLDHPNIAAIYGLEDSNTVRALVLALIEGPTLAERIVAGPIPLDEAIQIARQIAEAVEYAHDCGVIHRDLKPANIKITSGGMVKVLDFGLAKALDDEPAAASGTNSPTLTMGATRAGVLLGTAAYMSPEQGKGKQADRRSDIWSFGVVLYEMVTGKPPFSGESVGETIASVIKEEPKLDAVPAEIRGLVARCLNKDPRQRLQAIGEARITLGKPFALAEVQIAPTDRNRPWPWMTAGCVLLVALSIVSFIHFREKQSKAPPIRFEIPMPDKVTLGAGAFSLSPDGRDLVFAPATTPDRIPRLWIRSLDSIEARPLAGTEGAGNFPPFWSPDSRFVGFAAEGKYKKVDVSGGPAQTLCDFPGLLGSGSWSRSGVILINSDTTGLFRVPEAGGTPVPVTAVDVSRQETYHLRPFFLPDGRHFLYLRLSGNPEYAGTYVGSLDAKPEQQDRRRLIPGPFGVTYVPSSDPAIGYVLFVREATLMVQTFENRTLKLTGQPIPIAEQVGNNGTSTGFFSASQNGALAYRGGGGARRQFIWLDRQGKEIGNAVDPNPSQNAFDEVALSPDGGRVASFHRDEQRDIWVYEFARGVSSRLTFAPSVERFPVWSPDGTSIAFASSRAGHFDLYQKASNGAGEDELLLKSDQDKIPTSWSRDGRFLIYTSMDAKTKADLWALPLGGDRKPFPVLRTEFTEDQGSLSPDMHWIAYRSNESGRNEIYVRPFSPSPGAASSSVGGKWQVSKAGGIFPFWRGTGKELVYVAPADRTVMAVEVTTYPTFQVGVPQALFQVQATTGLDMTADGKRFLIVAPVIQNAQAPITILLNWTALLKK